MKNSLQKRHLVRGCLLRSWNTSRINSVTNSLLDIHERCHRQSWHKWSKSLPICRRHRHLGSRRNSSWGIRKVAACLRSFGAMVQKVVRYAQPAEIATCGFHQVFPSQNWNGKFHTYTQTFWSRYTNSFWGGLFRGHLWPKNDVRTAIQKNHNTCPQETKPSPPNLCLSQNPIPKHPSTAIQISNYTHIWIWQYLLHKCSWSTHWKDATPSKHGASSHHKKSSLHHYPRPPWLYRVPTHKTPSHFLCKTKIWGHAEKHKHPRKIHWELPSGQTHPGKQIHIRHYLPDKKTKQQQKQQQKTTTKQ